MNYAETMLPAAEAERQGYSQLTQGYTISRNTKYDQREMLRDALAGAPRDRCLVRVVDHHGTKQLEIWTRQQRYSDRRRTKQRDGAHEAGCTWAHNQRKL